MAFFTLGIFSLQHNNPVSLHLDIIISDLMKSLKSSRSEGVMKIHIREARREDFDDIWLIFQAVVNKGDTYAHLPETVREDALAYWLAKDHTVFVIIADDKILGSYFIRPNQPGFGSHIANASFMVHPQTQGGGLGRTMGLHALETARDMGFLAMQFNLVVTTNTGAIRLWQSLGFEIIGTIPRAFRHQQHGYVDAHIMYRDR